MKTRVLIKRQLAQKNYRTDIDINSMTSGLARRQRRPTLWSRVKVRARKGSFFKNTAVSLCEIFDLTGTSFGQELLDLANQKREARASQRIEFRKTLDVCVVLRVHIVIRAIGRKKADIADPSGGDLKATMNLDCFCDGETASANRWVRFRATLDEEANFTDWQEKRDSWTPCKKPWFDNQAKIDAAIEEFRQELPN